MARRRFTTEQIIGYLRQAEVMIGRGCTIEEMLREIEVTANTYLSLAQGGRRFGNGSSPSAQRTGDRELPS